MMTHPRWMICIAVTAFFANPAAVRSQNYPARTVHVIVPHPAGSPADVPPRGVAQSLSQTFGQPFVIENRDGADGIIGAEACARAAPDGYTICSTSSSVITVNPAFRSRLPYDPQRDFAPIIYLGTLNSVVLAHPSVPANSVRELVELAKAKPNTLTWATMGTTSIGPIFIAWLKNNAGAAFYQIPYKSTLQGLQATMTGDTQIVAFAAGPAASLVKAGKVKALAANGGRRTRFLPDVPSMKEAGYDLEFRNWLGIFAPAGTPREIVRRLNGEIAKVVADPQYREKFLWSQGLEPDEVAGRSPEEFAEFLKGDREQFAALMKRAGLRPE